MRNGSQQKIKRQREKEVKDKERERERDPIRVKSNNAHTHKKVFFFSSNQEGQKGEGKNKQCLSMRVEWGSKPKFANRSNDLRFMDGVVIRYVCV